LAELWSEYRNTNLLHKKILPFLIRIGKKWGFPTGTKNYMKKNVQGDKTFTLNKNVKERLNQWDNIAKVENDIQTIGISGDEQV
jgi:predicted nucleotide-binding protein (sugar kinase/HSP70/actin superfamily)